MIMNVMKACKRTVPMKKITKLKRKINSIAIFVCAVMCLSAVMTAAFSLVSCGTKSSEGDSPYVTLSSDGEKLVARIPTDETESKEVYLFGLDFWQESSDLKKLDPVAEAKLSGGEARAEIELDGQIAETLCKGYMFAVKEGEEYRPITGVYYVTNPRNAGGKVDGKEDVFPAPLKGAVGTASQLMELGAGSTVVTVNLSDLMLTGGGDGTIPYIWSGLTYYADRAAIEKLDKQIKGYTDSGIYVYLELVQTSSRETLPVGLKDMIFDAPAGRAGYALNMTTREGASLVCGIFDFLAERYGRGGDNGTAEAFIIGRRVNNMSRWYAGGPASEKGIRNYMNAVRAAYNILLSHTPKGRVYVATDNNWNVAESGNFTVRDMLSSFNNMVGGEGDFFWQVSVEANASDISDSSIWDDPLSTGRSDFISPANIETLLNQLSTEMYKCGGMQRHMLLNRFTVGGTDETARAASYAFAYYKCLYSENADGLIYGKLSDTAADTSRTGLLTEREGAIHSERKPIADIFAAIDDENGADLSFVSELIGSKWTHIYNKVSSDAPVRRSVHLSGGNSHSNDDVKTLTSFAGGDTFGFKPLASAKYVELRYSPQGERPMLYVSLESSDASDRAGVVTRTISAEMLEKAGYLGITLMVESDGVTSTVLLRVSGYDRKGIEQVLTAEYDVYSNTWEDIYCNIEDFIDEVDSDTVSLSVLTRPADADDKTTGMWLASIVTEAPAEKDFPVWIIVVLIVAAVIGGGVAFVLWFTKNYTFVRE